MAYDLQVMSLTS